MIGCPYCLISDMSYPDLVDRCRSYLQFNTLLSIELRLRCRTDLQMTACSINVMTQQYMMHNNIRHTTIYDVDILG